MKLSDIIQYINQALNYPAIIYNDVSLFFDTAISELNTTLNTDIPLVSTMISEYKNSKIAEKKNAILLSDVEISNSIYTGTQSDASLAKVSYYYDRTLRKYGILDKSKSGYNYKYVDIIYGINSNAGEIQFYQAYVLGANAPIWVLAEQNPYDLDMIEYLPDDWVLLWLIPYVCFEYTCRDGGTASTFAEKLTQGFQQLQNSYDVPSTVVLTTVSDRLAYRDLVTKNLPILNVKVATRAIYSEMKHARNINAKYGSAYDAGGFGL